MSATTTARKIAVAAPACDGSIHRADHLESWYDRGARSYVTARFCEHGHQMGAGEYSGTKAGQAADIRYLTATISEKDDDR